MGTALRMSFRHGVHHLHLLLRAFSQDIQRNGYDKLLVH